MTGELTVFTLDSDGFGGAIFMLILLGIAAVICFLISLIAIVSSNWKTASTFAVLTFLFDLIWAITHPVLILFLFAYMALICTVAYVKGSKEKNEKGSQEEPDEAWFDDEWTKQL